jgi:DNA polymerase-3 subunit alpha
MIPFFKSHYSINKSILTLDRDHTPNGGPRSIIKLIKENKIESPFLVDDSLSGFLEAYSNAKDEGLKINFGVRMTYLDSVKDKSKESIENESKIIIFLNDSLSYENLFKIYSKAATDGFYYIPRVDDKILEEFWSDGLTLGIPYYDSYIFNNHFKISSCSEPFQKCEKVYFIESNNVPFEQSYSPLLKRSIGEDKLVKSKSIYYENKEDFVAYLTMRCIGKKSSIEKPNLDHMCSDEFSLESYLENV